VSVRIQKGSCRAAQVEGIYNARDTTRLAN